MTNRTEVIPRASPNEPEDLANKPTPSGLVRTASAAEIVPTKKRKSLYTFETDPIARNKLHNRLFKKLERTIYEYSARVGQQAVVVATDPESRLKVFGARPLENAVKASRNKILKDLKAALPERTSFEMQSDPGLFLLPPLTINGMPMPLERMTQAQLRAFIPLMLKFSLDREKPGWGKPLSRPPWWPEKVPWENVRMDSRSEAQKCEMSWTDALRLVVSSCYEYHGREDLLTSWQKEANKRELDDFRAVVGNTDGTFSIVKIGIENPVVTMEAAGAAADGDDCSQLAEGHVGSSGQEYEFYAPVSTEIKYEHTTVDGKVYIVPAPETSGASDFHVLHVEMHNDADFKSEEGEAAVYYRAPEFLVNM